MLAFRKITKISYYHFCHNIWRGLSLCISKTFQVRENVINFLHLNKDTLNLKEKKHWNKKSERQRWKNEIEINSQTQKGNCVRYSLPVERINYLSWNTTLVCGERDNRHQFYIIHLLIQLYHIYPLWYAILND